MKTNLSHQLYECGMFSLVDGDIGLEFEVEGNLAPFSTLHWGAKGDGSLRNGFEYVLVQPRPIDLIPYIIHEWFDALKLYKYTANSDSLRTSIHVHINAQQFTYKQLYTFLTAYYLIEDILIAYGGPTRKGNLHCLGISDADQGIPQLVHNIQGNAGFIGFGVNTYKYAALNIPALMEFGSLEFRMMRGEYSSPEFIIEWVQQLYRMVHSGVSFKDPRDVLFSFKGDSPHQFLHRFFSPEFTQKLLASAPNYKKLMRNNFHYSFAIATAIPDWDASPIVKAPGEKKKAMNKKPIQGFLSNPITWNSLPTLTIAPEEQEQINDYYYDLNGLSSST